MRTVNRVNIISLPIHFSFSRAITFYNIKEYGGCQLLFMGLAGEYIMSINTRVIDRSMVVEEERVNFDVK